MKQIMFYINTLGNGGAERAISNTASYFAEHGWNVILLTSFRVENEYYYSKKIRRMIIEDENLKQSTLKRNVNRIRFIRNLCKKEQIDVVVSFMREPNVRALLATFGLRTKTIISVRNDPNREYIGTFGKMVGKILLTCADGAVFQTEDAKRWFPQKLQKKAKVIYNVVASKFFETTYCGEHDIITVGRISPQKNHTMLIKAFEKVHEKFPEERLVICGRTQTEMGIEELIKNLKLEDSVILLGQRDNVPEILSKAKLFVLSSDYEGMPNALMEAMAVGVPAVSTDCPCGGPRELFGKKLETLLTPVGNIDALADKMIFLLENDKERENIGKELKQRAHLFRVDDVGQKWIDYIESLL